MTKKIPVWLVTLLVALFITVFANFSFWSQLTERAPFRSEPLLSISFFIVIFALINFLLTLVSFKPLLKIITIVLLFSSASAAYFMDNYAVMIDKSMIRNVFATDMQEAFELFSPKLFITILLLGVIPSLLVYFAKINYQPFLKGLLQKGLVLLVCVGVIVGTLYSNYQELSFFGRNNRELRHLINPTNYIFSLKSIVANSIRTANIEIKPIENDAKKTHTLTDKPSLVILVLGETARAMNLTLNGYKRNTTPLLSSNREIINFNDVSSCGTATAVSVPCMFSKFTRGDFNYNKGIGFHNLLDVVKHAGYDVSWLDNNTGCQGVCDRVNYQSFAKSSNPDFCSNGNCVDEILLEELQGFVDQSNKMLSSKNQFIILHLNGNHGPTYHLRYPERFEVFKPTCKTNQLRSCSQEEIVNSYDNAILYTDYILDKTITFLKEKSKQYNTAMVYMSDHGESLGENNIYLHGLPYFIAPEQQKKVPFIVWLSNQYQSTYTINQSCIADKSSSELSHDNLFSSMIGLLDIQTSVHNNQLDIFDSCKAGSLATSKE